ncbi:MAG: dihydrolipoyl dehydrogenase [Candidatus Gastranaerophilales bacterium]|nr:dihydrolipoyl dehydrogenase [Candidatus Gastranaerophilales bacterium]
MFDLGVIGSGPAGYVAAIRASQRGLKVVLFEKNQIGGTCLNRGCIPTKTILHSCNVFSELKNSSKLGITAENISFDFSKIQERQKTVSEKIRKSLTNLIKSYGVTIVEEEATIEADNVIKTLTNIYEVKNIIVATGSKPNKITFNGSYNEDFVMTSDDVLNMTELPSSILIVGTGAIGIEWARILSTFGVKVTLVEMLEKVIPTADYEVSDRVVRLLKKSRIDFYTSTTIQEIQGKMVTLSNGKTIDVDCVLLGAGRKTDTIEVDKNFKTEKGNVFAIGDVNRISMLAHSGMRQAEEVVEYIVSGKESHFDKNLVPSVIYGTPEIASIGKTEQELQDSGLEYKKSFFPISALGKAYADDKIEGFVKILATENEILGAHIISEEASAMIQQVSIAMVNKLSPKKLQEVIFAHPTYSEGLLEGLFALDKIALHIPNN